LHYPRQSLGVSQMRPRTHISAYYCLLLPAHYYCLLLLHIIIIAYYYCTLLLLAHTTNKIKSGGAGVVGQADNRYPVGAGLSSDSLPADALLVDALLVVDAGRGRSRLMCGGIC
jgi:hypothetical protein